MHRSSVFLARLNAGPESITRVASLLAWNEPVRASIRCQRCIDFHGSIVATNLPVAAMPPTSRLTITRLSLFYLGSYLFAIGLGLLLAPQGTLQLLQSNGDYGDVFPRVAGMLMSGLGLSIFGMIRARSHELYPATLFIRMYFIACIVAFYAMTRDPLFLVLGAIVVVGLFLTLASYVYDRTTSWSFH